MNAEKFSRIELLRLARIQNVSPRLIMNFLEILGSPESVINHVKSFINNKNYNSKDSLEIKIPDKSDAEEELDNLKKAKAGIVFFDEIDYPRLLKLIPDFPIALTYIGNKELFNSQLVSMVGSRNASISGISFATKIGYELADRGFCVVSGFARGIDTAAHTGSIQRTIAVMPGGVDHIYPKDNEQIYEEIIYKDGLIISEKKLHANPNKIDFTMRNRVIAGLSMATCVIEAAKMSGSLITARFALEYNREVFAVPGHPLDPRSRGVNDLINSGANMLTDVQDIIEVLGKFNVLEYYNRSMYTVKENCDDDFNHKNANNPPLDPNEVSAEMREMVRKTLNHTPVTIATLSMFVKINVRFLHLILLQLELLGEIERHSNNRFSLPITRKKN